jgi:hypothetical protein
MNDDETFNEERMDGTMDDVFKDGVGKTDGTDDGCTDESSDDKKPDDGTNGGRDQRMDDGIDKDADAVMDGVEEGEDEGNKEKDREGLLSVGLAAEEGTMELLDGDEDGAGSDDDVTLKNGWTAPLVEAPVGDAVVMLDVRVASDKLMDDVEKALLVVLGHRGADEDSDEEKDRPEDEPLGE